MDECDIIVTRKEKIEPIHQNKHEPYEYYKYQVTQRGHMNECTVAVFEIPPGKSNYPFHYHMKEEEVFYIISGRGRLETVSGEREVGAGDIIVCPTTKNAAHKLTNASDTEKLVYIDFDTAHYPEVVYYPHSGKVGITGSEGENEFFRRDSRTDYYDGE